MEKQPDTPETLDAQKESGNRIADDLEKILSEENLSESVPRAVHTVVRLLRAGDIKSAKATYHWEADKLMDRRYKHLCDFLDSAFQ